MNDLRRQNSRPQQTFESWTPRTHESLSELARQSDAKRKQGPQSEANVCRRRRRCNLEKTSLINLHRTANNTETTQHKVGVAFSYLERNNYSQISVKKNHFQLKIQSDCFDIKRSRKHPTDCGLQQALQIYCHTWRWNVIKISAIFGRQKSLQNVGTSGYFLASTIFRTSFCWREVHIWKTSTYNPKHDEYSWPCCGSLNTLWCED